MNNTRDLADWMDRLERRRREMVDLTIRRNIGGNDWEFEFDLLFQQAEPQPVFVFIRTIKPVRPPVAEWDWMPPTPPEPMPDEILAEITEEMIDRIDRVYGRGPIREHWEKRKQSKDPHG